MALTQGRKGPIDLPWRGPHHHVQHETTGGPCYCCQPPDIFFLDEKQRTVLLIDVTCPMDINTVMAATIKHKKYLDLEIAMKKILTPILQRFHQEYVLPQSRRKFFW
eukprot:5618008-Ditylum_brightwellii.AAC.2